MPDMIDPIQKEIRFSVVMYGGVSLAIYINGVSQEIFKMVRATARKEYHSISEPTGDVYLFDESQLTPSEKVYRELGKHLKAAFVVDILSGTSAGGINAVYLAKALANNQPFQPLKDLWIQEGDIDLLIFDKKSFSDLADLSEPKVTPSLLNNLRMYYKLLSALDQMEGTPEQKPEKEAEEKEFKKSPYMGELDLFVTATDLIGLAAPLPVGSQKILEKQYRAVFRFHYSTIDSAGKNSNDFLKENNPFLAFTARCTSSFPLAFEPMCLGDIQPVLKSTPFSKGYGYLPEDWKRFYSGYDPQSFPDQPFGDGGYLDNKPFSYAIDMLSRRRADVPVERKMVYIEPAPEEYLPRPETGPIPRPDAIDNTLSAAFFLPRYETIREDFKSMADRNATITKVNEILTQMTPLTLGVFDKTKPYWKSGGQEWSGEFLDYSTETFGPAYAFYHQLRVDETIADVANALARNMNLDQDFEKSQRLQEMIEKDWRARLYSPVESDGHISENDILYRLDLPYRLRRLQFLQQIVNQLSLHAGSLRINAVEISPIDNLLKVCGVSLTLEDQQQEQDFRNELLRIKSSLNETYSLLRDAGRSLRARGVCDEPEYKLNVPVEYVQQVNELRNLLNQGTQDSTAISSQIEAITLLLFSRDREQPGYLRKKFSEAKTIVNRVLEVPEPPGQKELLPAQIAARKIIGFFNQHYEFYDMVTYPILRDAPLGESGVVEVYRISPEDATGILDQAIIKRKKLLGIKYENFGAFFEKRWRENDMVWGRLDGAECLINAVLPEESDYKNHLRIRVQDAILREEGIDQMLIASGAISGDLASFPLPENGESALIDAFREYKKKQLDETIPSEQGRKLLLRAAYVVTQVLKSMLDRRRYLKVLIDLVPPIARVINIWLAARAFLSRPFQRNKPAATKSN